MKKLLTVLLAMVMVLSIGVNAFAVTDITNWRDMDTYKQLIKGYDELEKIYSDYSEEEGDDFTFKSATVQYIGDGMCRTVMRVESRKHIYRMISLIDLVSGDTLANYTVRDDGLRYTDDEFLEIVCGVSSN